MLLKEFLAKVIMIFTFENLENALSFLKLIGNGFVLTLPNFIQGCYTIWSNVNLFSLGTRIFLIRSFNSGLNPMAYSAK